MPGGIGRGRCAGAAGVAIGRPTCMPGRRRAASRRCAISARFCSSVGGVVGAGCNGTTVSFAIIVGAAATTGAVVTTGANIGGVAIGGGLIGGALTGGAAASGAVTVARVIGGAL